MNQPFSGIPDPGFPRRRRRFEPGIVQEALQAARRQLQSLAHRAGRQSSNLWQQSRSLWLRGRRQPRVLALIGGAVALTLVGAYTVSASGAGRSLCPAIKSSSTKGQNSRFLLLMDQVPPAAAGSQLEIYYDVCGLPSGTAYSGKVRLVAAKASSKKKSAKPKPLAVGFKDKVDGPATRRVQQLQLGPTKPGTYTIELTVVDNQGRERKRYQKVRVKTQ
jgi:hypothetical protein